jgi:hypothetical protein
MIRSKVIIFLGLEMAAKEEKMGSKRCVNI